MTRLFRLSWTSLIVGLVSIAFVGVAFGVLWYLLQIKRMGDNIHAQQELLAPQAAPTPSAEALALANAETQALLDRQMQAAQEAADLKAASPAAAAEKPVPSAQFIVPKDSPELVPLNGWIDQPDKSKSGRLHTNLMVTRSTKAARPKKPVPVPCTKKVKKPAEHISLPWGWVDIPARTVSVPCDGWEG